MYKLQTCFGDECGTGVEMYKTSELWWVVVLEYFKIKASKYFALESEALKYFTEQKNKFNELFK
mgnify:CR=1 FL=1